MRRPFFTLIGLALVAGALAPATRAASPLTLGFNPIPTSPFWVDEAKSEGAGIVRIGGGWAGIAPEQPPPGFVASDPASPGYYWSGVDEQVRALTRHGLQPLLVFTGAPSWAEAPGRPSTVQPDSWEPDPAQFAQFAHAAALRYDGSYPDPLNPGMVLPRVRYWQAWNEPNLDNYLTPQWVRVCRRRFVPASPTIYRALLNAFYGAVKSVSRSNVVVTAAMSPYGDAPGVTFPGLGHRMAPLAFERALFSAPVHFDVLAQSIYPVHGPLWHAYMPDDVAASDIYKVQGVLWAGERAGHVLPRGHKPLWVTELGWNSYPPKPKGVPVSEQAQWYEQAMYVLWSQGVDTVLLLDMVDAPAGPENFFSGSGLYYVNGRPKPAATAFRFPFVSSRVNRDRVQVWGRAPVGGRVSVEQWSHGRWRVLTRVGVGRAQVFVRTIALQGKAVLRARVGDETSLPWTQGS